MTTDTGLQEVITQIDKMKADVAESYSALKALAVEPIGAAKLENLPQTIQRLAAGTTVNCLINPTGTDYQLPKNSTELAALITGAKVRVLDETGVTLAEGSVGGLRNQSVIVQVPSIFDKTAITVALRLGNNTYTAPAVRTYLEPDHITSVRFNTICSIADVEEIGRFQMKSDNSGLSYLIRRVTKADGTVGLHYGGFYVDSTGTAVWQNHSGLFTTVKSCASEESEVVVTPVNACSDEGARDMMETLKVFKEMRPVTAKSTDAAGTEILQKLMMYSKFYCKTEETELDIITYNEDGTIQKTEKKPVVIKWMCDTRADLNYHAHAMFVRSERTGDDTFNDTELDHAFYSRYPMNWVTAKPTASTSATVATCTADGICPTTAVSRDNANNYARNLNKLPFTITDDTTGDTIVSLPANADGRAWASASSNDISFFQWICTMLYGTEIQNVIMGNTTDAGSNPQTKNGQTDWLFEKGILFGSANNSSNTQPCVIAGIEDGIHSSQGTFMNDLTYFAERMIDEAGVESKRAFMMYSRDRLDWRSQEGSYDVLRSNGYRELSFDLNSDKNAANTTISNSRRRFGYDAGVGARDVMIPCADQSQPNFCEGAVDNFWFGNSPAVGTAGKSASLVALGSVRYNGRSLGLFAVNAYYGLSNANANSWRPRLSLQVVGV